MKPLPPGRIGGRVYAAWMYFVATVAVIWYIYLLYHYHGQVWPLYGHVGHCGVQQEVCAPFQFLNPDHGYLD